MEKKLKCNLCFRIFPNLRTHMKSHFPITRRLNNHRRQQPQLTESSSSESYLSSEEETEQIVNNKNNNNDVAYELRENPRKSFRVADPEFSFAGSSSATAAAAAVVVQDGESETESTRNLTRRRSNRTRKMGGFDDHRLNRFVERKRRWVSPPPPPAATAEQEPVSSVSDTSPEEDVAMFLVMMSRDVNWRTRFLGGDDEIEEGEALMGSEEEIEEIQEQRRIRFTRRGKNNLKCEKCTKQFRSSPALASHRRICSLNGTQLRSLADGGPNPPERRIFQCPYCFKVFGSGQALGGHKRSHLSSSGSYPPPPPQAAAAKSCSLLDLNFPPPAAEDDDYSVVSDV
ncbi:Zinc finger protein ZAT9 [Linum perenne]